ncbi:hypothetical protein Tco_1536690, partial [Tanacetum coccineum]
IQDPFKWDQQYVQKDSSTTREYPSLISTFFDTHTYDGVFAQDEAQVQYEEMLMLMDLEANMPSGVPYTKEEMMEMVRKGKQRGHILEEVNLLWRVVSSDDLMSQMLTRLDSQREIGGGSGSESGGGGDDEPGGDEDAGGDDDI